jgi:hypothetical protein
MLFLRKPADLLSVCQVGKVKKQRGQCPKFTTIWLDDHVINLVITHSYQICVPSDGTVL